MLVASLPFTLSYPHDTSKAVSDVLHLTKVGHGLTADEPISRRTGHGLYPRRSELLKRPEKILGATAAAVVAINPSHILMWRATLPLATEQGLSIGIFVRASFVFRQAIAIIRCHSRLSVRTLFVIAMSFLGGVAAVPSRQHTTRPMVTGTSVLGIKYKDGVMLAADTLLSYGSLAKAQGVSRLATIPNTSVLIGASGEYSDFTKLQEILTAKALEETTTSLVDSLYNTSSGGETNKLSAGSVWNYLRMLLYQRRNKMNPFWNTVLVAGMDTTGNRSFLGMVDKIGTTVQDDFLATGFGAYLALPLLREHYRNDLSEGEARALLEDCMKVLFYRDCRASSLIQLAKCDCTTGQTVVSEPYQLDQTTQPAWDAPEFVRPVADLDGDGGW